MSNIIPFYTSSDKFITKSEDCYQYDSEGKMYIDFESGVWCANIGHSNKQIANLIESQIKETIHHGYKFRNKFAESLSDELQRIIGIQDGASVFLSSGSEAVNLAIRISQHITNRKKILKIDNSYLSAYGYGQITPDNKHIVNVRFDDLESVDKIDFSEISAFVLETGGASIEMVQFPDYEFVRKIADLSTKNNCMIIAEEVTTGMGRTGRWFGFQHYDITPDITVAGKALGNGYPVSSITLTSKINERFQAEPFRYAQSHQNDPLGCMIGLEVIKYIEQNNLIEKCNNTGDYFKQQLQLLQQKYPEMINNIRGRGLMLALEFNESIDGEYIEQQLFDMGFIVGYKLNTLRFMPPLTIMTSDIEKLLKTLDTLLTDYLI